MHYVLMKGGQKSHHFFVDFHSDNIFGIARIDVDLIVNKKKDWKAQTVAIKITTKDKLG